MSEKLTVPEKQALRRQHRSVAVRVRNAFLKDHAEKDLKVGAGKGFEPDPICECHNRNPCPLDKELGI